MNALRATFSLMFLLLPALVFDQQTASANQSPTLCKVESLPPDVQNRLKEEFGSWKVQEPAHLSPRAHARWEDEKPLACPGIAVGQFENAKTPSYAVLLVPVDHPDAVTKVVGSNTTSYAWDFENRLTSVTLPGTGDTVSFKYDPFGRRIYKSSSSGTSIYAYDGDNLIEETNASGAVVGRYAQTEAVHALTHLFKKRPNQIEKHCFGCGGPEKP